jgi:hypothetical protein
MLTIYIDKNDFVRVDCDDRSLRRRLNREKVLVVRDAVEGCCIDIPGDVFETPCGLKVVGYFETVEHSGIGWAKVAEEVVERDEESIQTYERIYRKNAEPERTTKC